MKITDFNVEEATLIAIPCLITVINERSKKTLHEPCLFKVSFKKNKSK